MAVRCQKCGRPNSEQSARCIYCGAVLGEDKSELRGEEFIRLKDEGGRRVKVDRERFLVVVSPVEGGLSEEVIKGLRRLLGWDRYTVLVKFRGGAPWVLRRCEEASEVRELIEGLKDLGLDGYLVKESGLERLEQKLVAVSGAVDEERIVFDLEDGRRREMRYEDLFVLVRGRIGLEGELKKRVARFKIPEALIDKDSVFERYMQRMSEKKRSKLSVGDLISGEVRSEVELFDLYPRPVLGKKEFEEHIGVRVIESEFDFSSIFGGSFQPRLLGITRLREFLKERANFLIVDENFIVMRYAYSEKPVSGGLPMPLSLGLRKRAQEKLHSMQALFNEYSSLLYLHHLRRLKGV